MTGLEPEGASSWLSLPWLFSSCPFFVCLFFILAQKLFATEIIKCEPLRMSSFYIRATSVDPGRDISCIVGIRVPLLSCLCVFLKKGHRKSVPAFPPEWKPPRGKLPLDILPGPWVLCSVVTSIPPPSLAVLALALLPFDCVTRAAWWLNSQALRQTWVWILALLLNLSFFIFTIGKGNMHNTRFIALWWIW